MSLWMRLLLLLVTFVIPGGLLLLPFMARALQKRSQKNSNLDFDARRRRVPITRAPPPRGRVWQPLEISVH